MRRARCWEVAMEQRFDRSEEDLGNIVGLEHVNIMIPDQVMATLFYVSGLGLTRDPYLVTGITNMWINIGRSQFHLPTGKPQVLRRLQMVRKGLEGTAFAVAEHDDYVAVTSPWGNRIRCHAPDPRFGRITLGMPYVQFDVPPGSLEGIVKFYRRMLGAPARIAKDAEGRHARVHVGASQAFLFRESEGKLPAYDGHPGQIYIADFSGPHSRL